MSDGGLLQKFETEIGGMRCFLDFESFASRNAPPMPVTLTRANTDAALGARPSELCRYSTTPRIVQPDGFAASVPAMPR